MVKKTPCKFTCKDVFFYYFIGRQPYSEGSLSRAVHGGMPLLHRGFSLAFALDFLDLTTFLRQILGKIYLSDFLTTPHLFYYQISGILAIFFYSAFPSGKIILNTKKKITMETPPVIIVTSML